MLDIQTGYVNVFLLNLVTFDSGVQSCLELSK